MDFLQKLFKIRTKDPLRLMIHGRRDLDAAQLAQYRTRIQEREKELAEVSDGRELYHRFLSETSLSRALVIGITPDAPGISRPKPAKLSEEDFLKALNTLPAGVLIRGWLDEDLARLEIRDGSVCVVVPDIVLAGITESERKRLALGTEARIILRLERTGVAGLMYARGALHNPAVFADHAALCRGCVPKPQDAVGLKAMILRHIALARRHCPGRAALWKMRSVVPRYVRALPGARALRQELCRCEDWEAVAAALDKFLDGCDSGTAQSHLF